MATSNTPLVGIIMGSDSDLPVMQPAADILTQFGIAYELTVVSAHRTPKRMMQYAEQAAARQLKVIIAGVGFCAVHFANAQWHTGSNGGLERRKKCRHIGSFDHWRL